MKRQKETSLSTDLTVGEEAAKKLAQSFLIPREINQYLYLFIKHFFKRKRFLKEKIFY